jgi:putative toxin-antitoxin system antitoxin component (TIGR02293 family)
VAKVPSKRASEHSQKQSNQEEEGFLLEEIDPKGKRLFIKDSEGRFQRFGLVEIQDMNKAAVIKGKRKPFRAIITKLSEVAADSHKLRGEAARAVIGPEEPREDLLNQMVTRASEVLGTRDEALRWLGTPVRALNFATPIALVGTEEGAQRVRTVLGQMEHGVW